MSLLKLKYTHSAKKQLKKINLSSEDKDCLEKCLDSLCVGKELPKRYHDHSLSGNWINHREFHLRPNLLVIYSIDGEELILTVVAVGRHHNLLGI
ncbi:toxin of toxin-antitoxin stability system [Lacticaseibacillus rhamnosus]|uniref:type II toxin-antitoxin system YafQ family toxin n=1 Tax=Lacticaseibacillus rhamnosus TaxID=47715 RepID=UPI0005E7217F|nr:toxin of toxin-antitoxin stability system [Lacticaseibacillus rhamnosus]